MKTTTCQLQIYNNTQQEVRKTVVTIHHSARDSQVNSLSMYMLRISPRPKAADLIRAQTLHRVGDDYFKEHVT